MPFEHDADPASLYDDLRRSFVDRVVNLTEEQRATRVPATPDWTVADVLAHVVGIASDLNHGRFHADMDPDAWTAAQVALRRDRPVAEVAEEWATEAPQFVDGLRLFGYEFGAHYVGDLLQHVADVAHALALPQPPDDLTLAVALDFYLEVLDESLRTADLGSIVIHTTGNTTTVGSGEPTTELATTRYELFRSLGGRRSESQVRALGWSGDPDMVLPALSPYSFAEQAMIETTT